MQLNNVLFYLTKNLTNNNQKRVTYDPTNRPHTHTQHATQDKQQQHTQLNKKPLKIQFSIYFLLIYWYLWTTTTLNMYVHKVTTHYSCIRNRQKRQQDDLHQETRELLCSSLRFLRSSCLNPSDTLPSSSFRRFHASSSRPFSPSQHFSSSTSSCSSSFLRFEPVFWVWFVRISFFSVS